MSYKTPTVASLTLLGIDKKCQDISGQMTDLTWLSYAFGLADRMVELRDEKDYVYPACYISNTKDPINAMPSDLYNALCFWIKDPEALFNYENNPNRMYYKLSCIFFMCLEKISPYINYKETKTKLRQDIIKFFDEHKDGGAFGVLELVRIIDDDITEVYKEFSIEQVDNRFKMLPKYALRIDFNFAFLLECPPAVYNSFVTDYDGNVYSSVIIGTQEWMVENLCTTHYADGTLIPNVTIVAAWMAEDGTAGHDGAYSWYDNDEATYKDDYGALYNGYAVINPHGLAPSGWRIPTETDRDILTTFVGGAGVAGGKLKETGLTHWTTPNTGAVDTYGWKGVGNGYRAATGTFNSLKDYAYFWTATQVLTHIYCWHIAYDNDNLLANDLEKRNGYAVRCMRDV